MGRFSSCALAVAALMVVGGFAGCLGSDPKPKPELSEGPVAPQLDVVGADVATALEKLLALRDDPILFDVNLTYDVVFVGFDPAIVDEERIRDQLPERYSPRMAWGRTYGEGLNSPLLYHFDYRFHHAPAAFGEELFAFAKTTAREVPANDFLKQYDEDYGLGRAARPVLLLDAEGVESWIAENRTRHGLEFAKPGYTIFYFDTWTPEWMPRDQYYYYEFRGALFQGPATQTLRAWGGTYDFLFMDFGAAPNNIGNDNSNYQTVPLTGGLSQGAPAREGTAYNDPPMWHYEGEEATVGKAPGTEVTRNVNDRVAYDSNVAVNIRLVASYAFRPVYKPVYYINMHLWHDGRSIHDTNLEQHVDAERWLDALQQEIPWASVTGKVTTYVLPNDDPGMDRALTEAKAQGAGAYIPIDPVVRYIDANEERYINTTADVFNVRALLFILEGAYTFYLPAVVGGVAFGDPEGQAWGTISSVNDAQNVQNQRSTADRFTRINTHEVGHFFGLHHAHDGTCTDRDGRYFSCLDHTWSQTNTVMSYRFTPFTADALDRDTLARGHTTEVVALAVKEMESAYRGVAALGLATAPRDVATPLAAAEESLNTALRLYEGGMFIDAVHAAIAGLEHAKRAVAASSAVQVVEEKVLDWETSGVNHAAYGHAVLGGQLTANVPGIVKDYERLVLDEDVEKVRIRVSWTNSPASWGDFFVGWDFGDVDRRNTAASQLPGESDGIFYLGAFGVWDVAKEKPLDGEVVREHVIDLAKFPILRERNEIVVGSGTQGDAVNGAYHVEVFVRKRAYGDEPSAAATEPASPVGEHEAARDDLVRVSV